MIARAWKQFVNTLPNVVGFLRALWLIPYAGTVNLTGCCVHCYGRFSFFDMFLNPQMFLKSKQTIYKLDHNVEIRRGFVWYAEKKILFKLEPMLH